MRISIPSYRRANTLATKTIPLLTSRGVPEDAIDIFLSDPAETDEYRAALAQWPGITIIPAVIGIGAIRNFIADYYPKGEHIVGADDDLSDLIEKTGEKTAQPLADVWELCGQAFQAARANGCTIWGIYPVSNPYFMKSKLTTNLVYIVACFYGWVANPGAEWHHVVLDDKEDFERSIRFYEHDGAVLRINWVAPVTRYYTEPGGNQVTRTQERITYSAQWLLEHFPQFCAPNTRKKDYAEVKLKDMRTIGADETAPAE